MFPSLFDMEMFVKERQKKLLAEAQRDRLLAALSSRGRSGRRPLAPAMNALGRLLINAGERLRRAATPSVQ